MTQLITVNQIAQYKQMTVHINSEKLVNPYIMEAQDFDIRPFLGDEFYLDLLDDFDASPSLEVYSDLYNGSSYTYQEKTYHQDGLAKVLAYFSYGRYLPYSNAISTSVGQRQKLNPSSELVPSQTISAMLTQAKSAAVVCQERVRLYLDRNKDLYPLWNQCDSQQRRTGSIRITAIGSNSSKVRPHYPCNNCGEYYCKCYGY